MSFVLGLSHCLFKEVVSFPCGLEPRSPDPELWSLGILGIVPRKLSLFKGRRCWSQEAALAECVSQLRGFKFGEVPRTHCGSRG